MPKVTALRERAGSRVVVELDGTPWRTLPLGVVVGAGLSVGAELDRQRARDVRRELRRAEALTVAARALRARDRTRAELGARLGQAGIREAERDETLRTLVRGGLVDDERFARSRAEALAERGYGDGAIRWDLEQRGVEASAVDGALAGLASEPERAAALVRSRRGSRVTASFLARRGFAEDAVEFALGAGGDHG